MPCHIIEHSYNYKIILSVQQNNETFGFSQTPIFFLSLHIIPSLSNHLQKDEKMCLSSESPSDSNTCKLAWCLKENVYVLY